MQRACPTLLPNNDEALDLSEVVEGEDNADDKADCEADCEGIEKLVGASKTLLAELIGAACDVPVR